MNDRYALGGTYMFTADFFRSVYGDLIDKREGEFDFADCTFRVVHIIDDALRGTVVYQCERVL